MSSYALEKLKNDVTTWVELLTPKIGKKRAQFESVLAVYNISQNPTEQTVAEEMQRLTDLYNMPGYSQRIVTAFSQFIGRDLGALRIDLRALWAAILGDDTSKTRLWKSLFKYVGVSALVTALMYQIINTWRFRLFFKPIASNIANVIIAIRVHEKNTKTQADQVREIAKFLNITPEYYNLHISETSVKMTVHLIDVSHTLPLLDRTLKARFKSMDIKVSSIFEVKEKQTAKATKLTRPPKTRKPKTRRPKTRRTRTSH